MKLHGGPNLARGPEFDTHAVDHEILCQKLELLWFKPYLINRKKYCRISSVDSNINDINVVLHKGLA